MQSCLFLFYFTSYGFAYTELTATKQQLWGKEVARHREAEAGGARSGPGQPSPAP